MTGFGAFESVPDNPSGAIARALDDGRERIGVVLPVSFRGSAEAFDRTLRLLRPRRPERILCTGVHPGPGFRLERRARARLGEDRPDNDGVTGAAVSGAMGGGDGDLATRADLEALGRVLRRAGAPEVALSDDAGGYVCERLYRHALVRAAELDVTALFLHVPPLATVPLREQVRAVRALSAALREGDGARDGASFATAGARPEASACDEARSPAGPRRSFAAPPGPSYPRPSDAEPRVEELPVYPAR